MKYECCELSQSSVQHIFVGRRSKSVSTLFSPVQKNELLHKLEVSTRIFLIMCVELQKDIFINMKHLRVLRIQFIGRFLI